MNDHTLVANISRGHQEALSGAAGAVNRHLLLRNWLIERDRAAWEQKRRGPHDERDDRPNTRA